MPHDLAVLFVKCALSPRIYSKGLKLLRVVNTVVENVYITFGFPASVSGAAPQHLR